ncbi:Vacuolar protein sorting-associated protein [Trifolium repens]|nr:Vacuolar protein sorting-associated protein [Trifolium repens]
MSVQLKLSRPNRIYRPSELLEGKITVETQSSISHYGIRLTIKGSVNLQVRGGSAGVVESFYGVIKPIPIVKRTVKLNLPERLVRVQQRYHISIQYLVAVDISRGYLHKSLSATTEFIIQSDKGDLLQRPLSPEMVIFYITQDTQRHPLLPELKSGGFRVTGKICTQCSLSSPINGELTVEASAVPIQSIDIQLFRVESILHGEKIVTETSLIQTTQIADGDVCRKLTLPIYVILPRLLTCPTIFAGPFSIEFKVAIVISFQSELSKLHKKPDSRTPRLWLAMETLPLELVRMM